MDPDQTDNTGTTDTNLLLGALILAILLFSTLSIYYYFASRKLAPKPSRDNAVSDDIQNKLDAGAAAIEKNINKQEPRVIQEAKAFKDECRLTNIDPKNGIERFLKITDSVAEYYYTLKVISAETVSLTKKNVPCRYVKLSLRPKVPNSPTMTIYLPAGITYDLGIGKVSPLIYTTQVGMTVTMILTVQNTLDAQNPYKFLSWRPLRFSLN